MGAAVGLGSIWRFPYLAGTGGGFAFIFVFVLVCIFIAIPLLMGEFLIGRWSQRSPPEAAGAIAVRFGLSRGWNIIGWLGTAAGLLILSYYSMIAGWALAYTWRFATGALSGVTRPEVADHFKTFVSHPGIVGAWQFVFIAIVAGISGRGLKRGIEVASKFRAPALLLLLLGLVAYALATGDVARGLAFAFYPDFSKVTPAVVLAAIGQAFYATGVGIAMMLAYGAYLPKDVSLTRSSLIVTGSILIVSILATVLIFPLVFAYKMSPATGPELIFIVLPTAFVEMPAGRLIGTLFFVLLVLASLTPSIASLEPMVSWLEHKRGVARRTAAWTLAACVWIFGQGSTLSFGVLAHWRPLGGLPIFHDMNFFAVVDFVSANIFLLLGALMTCVFLGWRIATRIPKSELSGMSELARSAMINSLRYICPLAILAILVAAFA